MRTFKSRSKIVICTTSRQSGTFINERKNVWGSTRLAECVNFIESKSRPRMNLSKPFLSERVEPERKLFHLLCKIRSLVTEILWSVSERVNGFYMRKELITDFILRFIIVLTFLVIFVLSNIDNQQNNIVVLCIYNFICTSVRKYSPI